MLPINICIGYDSTSKIAFQVLVSSIIRRASVSVSITPIFKHGMPYTRLRKDDESTEFSFTRFLTPYLCGYKGIAIYMDCDMLCLDDIYNLWQIMGDDSYARRKCAVMVVDYGKFSHISGATKMRGAKQVDYPCKNWSSLMLMNCEKCLALTPHSVNVEEGNYLHQFKWLTTVEGEGMEVGFLPNKWNYLVGYNLNKLVPNPSLVHYTLGGPWISEYKDTEYSKEWFAELEYMSDVDTGYCELSKHVQNQQLELDV